MPIFDFIKKKFTKTNNVPVKHDESMEDIDNTLIDAHKRIAEIEKKLSSGQKCAFSKDKLVCQ